MAKSARSSNTKRNNRNLRAKVFGPASDARTARLSAKLQELAAKPRPTQDKEMELDPTVDQAENEDPTKDSSTSEDMDVDQQQHTKAKSKIDHKQRRKEHRVSKRKPRNQVVFTSERARKAKMASKKGKH